MNQSLCIGGSLTELEQGFVLAAKDHEVIRQPLAEGEAAALHLSTDAGKDPPRFDIAGVAMNLPTVGGFGSEVGQLRGGVIGKLKAKDEIFGMFAPASRGHRIRL